MLSLAKLFVLLSVFCAAALAAPYQELPSKPGYIPVYIREGNTPLSQINPKLAQAFHEDEEQQLIPQEIEVAKDNEKYVATEYIKKIEKTNKRTALVNGAEGLSNEK